DSVKVDVIAVVIQVLAAFNGDIAAHIRSRQHWNLRGTHATHVWQGGDSFAKFIDQGNGALRVIAVQLRLNRERDHVLSIESEILFAEIPESLGKKRCSR